jgi:hypothetical protein
MHRAIAVAARLGTTIPKILAIIPPDMSPDISESDLERFAIERLNLDRRSKLP